MTIQTKFDIGNAIHFLHNNRALDSVVRGVKIEYKGDAVTEKKPEIIYLCCKEPPPTNIYIKVNEDDCFETKDKLLKSL